MQRFVVDLTFFFIPFDLCFSSSSSIRLDCGINAHRHCKDQVVMECRQKRSHQVNKQGSVTDSRATRSSTRVRKSRKQKATQTEDINFSSTSSSSATSESCTSSSDEDQPSHHLQNSHLNDKTSHHYPWHLRKPSSLKRRKQISSDSNDDYYYTHPPSPQQATSLTTITSVTMTNSSTSTNPIPAPQLIPRGPLICSDSFEKWNDRCFTWNRTTLPPSNLLSSISTSSNTTSESTITKEENSEKELPSSLETRRTFLPRETSDDDACFTSLNNDKTPKVSTLFASNEYLNPRKVSAASSLQSLPTKPDQAQQEIFERLRQAEEVR